MAGPNQNHNVTIVPSGCDPSSCWPHSPCCFGTDCFCLKGKVPQVVIPIIINYHISIVHRCTQLSHKTCNLHILLGTKHHAGAKQTQNISSVLYHTSLPKGVSFQTFDTVAKEEPLPLEENKCKKKIVKEEIMIHVLRRVKRN